MRQIVLFAIGCVIAFNTANAQSITPNEIFQATDTILLELESLHKKNFTKPANPSIKLSPKELRHVYEKARSVFLKVQMLRYINGLFPNKLEKAPVRDITPSNVKSVVDGVLVDIRELRTVYGVTDAVVESPLSDGKSPADIYGNLIRIDASLDALGVPITGPNDVYQISSTIVQELEKIRAKEGVEADITKVRAVTGKRPNHVMEAIGEFLESLKTLAANERFAVPGGIIIPNLPDTNVSDGDTLSAMTDVLAEIGAMKSKLGITEPTALLPLQSGKTPSEIYQSIMQAQLIVDALSKS